MIKTYIFDAYGTLFDVYSVKTASEQLYPGKGDTISKQWRDKQLEYFFLRQLMNRYRPFHELTRDALHYTCKAHNIQLTPENEQTLMNAYLQLSLFDEAEDVLAKLNGTKIIFSNGSKPMIDPLVEQSAIRPYINRVISADEIKQYKPAPAAYHYALDQAGVHRHEVLFMSSNPWDIMGAKSFGFQTAWVNRNGLQPEELDIQPDMIIENLSGLLN